MHHNNKILSALMKRAVTTSSNSMSMNIGSHSGNVPLNHMMTLQQQYLLGSGDDTNNNDIYIDTSRPLPLPPIKKSSQKKKKKKTQTQPQTQTQTQTQSNMKSYDGESMSKSSKSYSLLAGQADTSPTLPNPNNHTKTTNSNDVNDTKKAESPVASRLHIIIHGIIQSSQQLIHDWDRKFGLRRAHSKITSIT